MDIRRARSWARRLARESTRVAIKVAALRARRYPPNLQNSYRSKYAVVSMNIHSNLLCTDGISGWRGIRNRLSGGAIFRDADSHAKGRCAFVHTRISHRAESIMHVVNIIRMTNVWFWLCSMYSYSIAYSSIHPRHHLTASQGLCAQLATTTLGALSTGECIAISFILSSEGCASANCGSSAIAG